MKTGKFFCPQRFIITIALLASFTSFTQQQGDPKLTEVWNPSVRVVTAGKISSGAPFDAVVLFDGNNAAAWQMKDGKTFGWKLADTAMTVVAKTGDIQTKEGFGDCQLHIEWRTPSVVKGEGQGRGNSGIFFMGRYELQVLDSYNNKTYSNGQAGSIYKQHMPLANASRAPGEWQVYDVVFTAPRFGADSSLKSPARITVLHNGVLVQNNAVLWGSTQYIGLAKYEMHSDKEPIVLQDHGDAVSFRNIWIRRL